MVNVDEYGVTVRIRTGNVNRITMRKLPAMPLCPQQIPYDLTWEGTLAAAEGSQNYGMGQRGL
jgi:hypothetical protein